MEETKAAEIEPLTTGEKQAPQKAIEDFQDILEIVGSQGKYQKRLLYFIVCPIMAIEALLTMNTLFLVFAPDHYCHVPGFVEGVYELDEWKNMTLPREMGADGRPRFSRCLMYDLDGNGTEVPCTNGWEYDTADYDKTLATEFNWVCDRAEYSTHVFSIGAFGATVGQVFFGILADKFGRKPIFFISLLFNTAFKFGSYFCPQFFTAFLIVNFLSSAGMPLVFISPSMIAAELCDNEYRTRVYSMTWMIWVAGMASMPLIAWICRDWFLIAMISTVPGLLCLLCYPFLPESPRWLCTMGRIEEAVVIIEDVARVNGNADKVNRTELGIWLRGLYDLHKKGAQSYEGFWSFFGRWRLARNTMMLSICWSINSVIYECITLNTPNMSGNQFLNFFMLSITEIPATILGDYLLQNMGRRWTQVLFFFLGAIGCFAGGVLVFYPELYIASIVVVILAKFCVTLTFLVVYLQATELFPTKLRSTGNSICSTFAGVVAIYGPQIVYAGQYYAAAPYLVMGGLAVVGAVAAAILPETLHQNLPETLQDANRFGKNHKFWSRLPKKDLPTTKTEPTPTDPAKTVKSTTEPAKAFTSPSNPVKTPELVDFIEYSNEPSPKPVQAVSGTSSNDVLDPNIQSF